MVIMCQCCMNTDIDIIDDHAKDGGPGEVRLFT